jgi:ATPase components of ABC transporters with duplicated ATPase domains
MTLLSLDSIGLSYGLPPLLEGVSFAIERGERICLIGRNGAGKSTLLRIIAGELQPDSGRIHLSQGLRIGYLAQDLPAGSAASVFEVVVSGLGELGALVRAYFDRSHALGPDASGPELARLAELQHRLEEQGGWEIEQRAERVIARLGLDAEARFDSLSGGMQRRVMLARALVVEPDLLLLDEPTNHLDIDSITWLEEFLVGFRGALLFITHDRRFLQRVATRILELDRGRLTDWPGDYANYLRRREERLHAEAQANAHFDRRLAEEEVWIRQGIKARRTRNEGRVRALEAMRAERRARRALQGAARLQLSEAERSGKLVVEAEGVTHRWGDKIIIRDFSTLIWRGDKVGIIGPNGVGKSTLLKLLLGELEPQQRPHPARLQSTDRLFRPETRPARPGEERARHRRRWQRSGRGGGDPAPRPVLSQGLPVLPGTRQPAGQGALGRRAQPSAAGQALYASGQSAGTRRADQ